jgi:hypothetical protein
MTRRRRSLFALLAAFALVFAQFAASAHACDAILKGGMSHTATGHPEGCPDAGPKGNVCTQHCQYGHASVDIAKPLPAIDVALGVVVAVLDVPRVAGPAPLALALYAPAQGPPPDAHPLPLRI